MNGTKNSNYICVIEKNYPNNPAYCIKAGDIKINFGYSEE